VDLEFPRGRGDQVEKSWQFQGVEGGSTIKLSRMENPRGWGFKLEKNSPWAWGLDIFWYHTIQLTFSIFIQFIHERLTGSLIFFYNRKTCHLISR